MVLFKSVTKIFLVFFLFASNICLSVDPDILSGKLYTEPVSDCSVKNQPPEMSLCLPNRNICYGANPRNLREDLPYPVTYYARNRDIHLVTCYKEYVRYDYEDNALKIFGCKEVIYEEGRNCSYDLSFKDVPIKPCLYKERERYHNNYLDKSAVCETSNTLYGWCDQKGGKYWYMYDFIQNKQYCIISDQKKVCDKPDDSSCKCLMPLSYLNLKDDKCELVDNAEFWWCASPIGPRCKEGYEMIAPSIYPFPYGACLKKCPENATRDSSNECKCKSGFLTSIIQDTLSCVWCPDDGNQFFQDGKCVSCPHDGQHFIMPVSGKLGCIECKITPGGTYYMLNGECRTCIQNATFDAIEQKCKCKAGYTASLTGSMCVSSTTSDVNLGSLLECSVRQELNTTTGKCVCKADFKGDTCNQCVDPLKTFIQDANSCIVIDTSFLCPPGRVADCKTLDNGNKSCACINSCEDPTPSYDVEKKQCICHTGKTYNGKCVDTCPDFYKVNDKQECTRQNCTDGKTLIKSGDCIVAGLTDNNGSSFSACQCDNLAEFKNGVCPSKGCNTGLECYFLRDTAGNPVSSVGYCVLKETTGKCNTNLDCRYGFVCTGGIGNNVGSQTLKNGICKPTIVLRQICLLIQITNGIIARGTVALCLISLTMAFLFGKMDYKPLIAFAIGVALIFGSFQVMFLITGDRYESCDLINTITLDFIY